MACVVCNDSGYEGQYVQGLLGTVCFSCLDKHHDDLYRIRMLSQRLSMTISPKVYRELSRDFTFLKQKLVGQCRT